jgi:hypothetical protein
LYGHGIPSRVARRIPQIQQKLVILSSAETWDSKMADFLFRPLNQKT